jgi:hypothetical protein
LFAQYFADGFFGCAIIGAAIIIIIQGLSGQRAEGNI